MDERPDEIIGHIEVQRDQLGRNLNELETRVRRTTDWRTYYDRNPMLTMGAALGGGLLLGSVIGTKTSRRAGYTPSKYIFSSLSSSATGLASAGNGASSSSESSSRRSSRSSQPQMTSQHMGEISRTLEDVKAALMSFGVAKAKEFLSQAVPGLDQHLGDAERKH